MGEAEADKSGVKLRRGQVRPRWSGVQTLYQMGRESVEGIQSGERCDLVYILNISGHSVGNGF